MSKRRLTQNQQSRLKHIQAKRIERAQERTGLEQDNPNGLGPEQPGILIAHYGTTLIVENQAEQLFQCKIRQNLGTLVTGDKVIWQAIDDNTGVVVAHLPRHSTLTRPDKRSAKPIAANVDHLVIVLALEPLPKQTTLDRYLVLAESLGLGISIVINKCDLAPTQEQRDWLAQMQTYADLGYECLRISTKNKQGIEQVRASLKNYTSILVGQSGVGKSSLLNVLIPEAAARTNVLSSRLGLGQHTTTASRLYHLPGGGDIIDSPGIHQFDLHHFSKSAIENAFTEFAPYLGRCRFRDCKHGQEPGCALQEAVETGKIAAFRLANYHAILSDLA